MHDSNRARRSLHTRLCDDEKKRCGGSPLKRRAVFMDRDGTISEEIGYVNHPSRYRVFPYSAEAVRILNEAGWLAILVTNQAGVARGYFTEDLIKAVHDRLRQELE